MSTYSLRVHLLSVLSLTCRCDLSSGTIIVVLSKIVSYYYCGNFWWMAYWCRWQRVGSIRMTEAYHLPIPMLPRADSSDYPIMTSLVTSGRLLSQWDRGLLKIIHQYQPLGNVTISRWAGLCVTPQGIRWVSRVISSHICGSLLPHDTASWQ